MSSDVRIMEGHFLQLINTDGVNIDMDEAYDLACEIRAACTSLATADIVVDECSASFWFHFGTKTREWLGHNSSIWLSVGSIFDDDEATQFAGLADQALQQIQAHIADSGSGMEVVKFIGRMVHMDS